MNAQETLRMAVVTSNYNKLKQAGLIASPVIDLKATQPLFDENKIKLDLKLPFTDGIEYIAAISRLKILEQRRLMLEQDGLGNDAILVVSDSGLMYNNNGVLTAVNKDAPPAEKRDAIEVINNRREILFVGAVSFGRLRGQSAWTVLTYCAIPLQRDLKIDDLPVNIDKVPNILDSLSGGYEVGYISFGFDPQGKLIHKRNKITQTQRFDESKSNEIAARPFISGLVPDVLSFAQKVANMDHKSQAVLERLVSAYPFNTLSFYTTFKEYGAGRLGNFYEQVAEHSDEYFAKYGANCAFFTLELLQQMNFSEPKVIIYPSGIHGDKQGHSAVLVREEDIDFLFDPGLTIPWVIPVHKQIPLAPFSMGDKLILAGVGYFNVDNLPDFVIVGRNEPFAAQRAVTPQEFRDSLPLILGNLHEQRLELKLAYHRPTGEKIIGITLDRNTHELKLKIGQILSRKISLKEFLEDAALQQGLQLACDKEGIKYNFIYNQLAAFLHFYAIQH